jgi:ubiquitin carboxyl-terminal hydrolase 7
MDDNFGGEMVSKTGAKTLKRYTNAYMLVYVRNSDIDWILEPVTEEDIPSHLRK